MRDEVIVITGASAGLGRATAREFGRHGAKIGLIARGIEGLEAAKREIESAGVESAAASVEEAFGPIDTWVNNAMASVFSPVKEMIPDEYKRVTEVTYLPCLRHTRSPETQAASQSRNDRSGWIGLGLSKYSAAIRLLCC